MLHLIFSVRSVTSLCGLFLGFAAIAAWFAGRGLARHALAYALGCGATAVAAVAAVTLLAITGSHADALHATALYTFYGVACVLISTRWQRRNELPRLEPAGRRAVLGVDTAIVRHLAGHGNSRRLPVLAGGNLAAAGLLASEPCFAHGATVALGLAAAVAATAWLQTQDWVTQLPRDLLDPRSLQTFGIALATISLAWIALRQSQPAAGRLPKRC